FAKFAVGLVGIERIERHVLDRKDGAHRTPSSTATSTTTWRPGRPSGHVRRATVRRPAGVAKVHLEHTRRGSSRYTTVPRRRAAAAAAKSPLPGAPGCQPSP